MTIFSKNSVLAGQLDYYCLVCAEQFQNEDSTLAHIVGAQHKDKLKACGYFEKYKEHFIRKVGGIYFCEPCSQTFPTATKVGIHIENPSHVEEINKSNQQWLKRVNNDIVAYDQLLVTEEAWNGFVEDTCMLCNTEFDDCSSHKASSNHILNLIKSEVTYDHGIAVYRSIDARSNHCLICNTIFGEDITIHCQSSEHKSASKVYNENRNNQNNDTMNHVNETENTPRKNKNEDEASNHEESNNKNKSVEKNAEEKSNHVEPNNNEKGVQNVADKKSNHEEPDNNNKSVEKDADEKSNHVEPNNNEKLDIDKKVQIDKIKQSGGQSKNNAMTKLEEIHSKNLGAKNYITNQNGKYMCILCDLVLDETPNKHIRGKHHQSLLKKNKKRIQNISNNNNNVANNVNKPSLFECVEKYQKSNVNIDLINETAVCKKCSQNIDFNTDAIEKHIEGHNNLPNKKSEKVTPLASGMKSDGTEKTTLYTKPVLRTAGNEKPDSQPVSSAKEAEDYAKLNGLIYNRADNSFYCNSCSRRLSTALEGLKKHVDSSNHKENISKQAVKKNIYSTPSVKVALTKFIDTFEVVETRAGIDVIINFKYWVNDFDFFLIEKLENNGIVCLGCDIDLINKNVMQHIQSQTHSNILEKSLVIASLEDEFVREIRVNVYHCGFCNVVKQGWNDILEHLATQEHKTKKLEAQRRVRNHEPDSCYTLRPKENMLPLTMFCVMAAGVSFFKLSTPW